MKRILLFRSTYHILCIYLIEEQEKKKKNIISRFDVVRDCQDCHESQTNFQRCREFAKTGTDYLLNDTQHDEKNVFFYYYYLRLLKKKDFIGQDTHYCEIFRERKAKLQRLPARLAPDIACLRVATRFVQEPGPRLVSSSTFVPPMAIFLFSLFIQ